MYNRVRSVKLWPKVFIAGLSSSRARWPLAPNFCPRASKKFSFGYKSNAGHHGFYRFRALGSFVEYNNKNLVLTSKTCICEAEVGHYFLQFIIYSQSI